MASVSTYLNFARETEEAFKYYKTIFGGEFGQIMRFGEMPPQPGMPPLPDADKNLLVHIELKILGDHLLMGTDAPESMGFAINKGNNVHVSLSPDSRAESKKLFDALSAGGQITMPIQDMFWGAYFGSCVDKYGIQWMVNCTAKE